MSIEEIIVILQNKITGLQAARIALIHQGNLQGVVDLDIDILSTQSTLDQLKSLD